MSGPSLPAADDNPDLQVAGSCAVCGGAISYRLDRIYRETPVCGHCGSVPRFCGLALAASRAVWGEPDRPLADRARRAEIVAIGMSDDDRLARILTDRLDYTNTQFHREPRLDLSSEESCSRYCADLIICSEVLEHTIDPPARPLQNLFNMLRPGGTLVLSAPTYLCASTVEWYGGAAAIEIVESEGRHLVRWRNRRGTEYVDDRPVFHDGSGTVLEMRIISHCELLAIARAVGFVGDTLPFAPEWGYFWPIIPISEYIPEAADARVIVLSRPRMT